MDQTSSAKARPVSKRDEKGIIGGLAFGSNAAAIVRLVVYVLAEYLRDLSMGENVVARRNIQGGADFEGARE